MAILAEYKAKRLETKRAGRSDRQGMAHIARPASLEHRPKTESTQSKASRHLGTGARPSEGHVPNSPKTETSEGHIPNSPTEEPSEGLVPNLLTTKKRRNPITQPTAVQESKATTRGSGEGTTLSNNPSEQHGFPSTRPPGLVHRSLAHNKEGPTAQTRKPRPIPFETVVRLSARATEGSDGNERVLAWARECDRKRKAERDLSAPNPEETPSGGDHSERALAGEKRNTKRWRLADEADIDILGEYQLLTESDTRGDGQLTTAPIENWRYLHSDPNRFFPPTIIGPDDSVEPPGWFLPAVTKLWSTNTATPTKPPIEFVVSRQAEEANAALFQSFDFRLDRIIEAHPLSTLGYGSEFRTIEEITPLLRRHPNFQPLRRLLQKGMAYVFSRELDEHTKREEMLSLLDRGNHKSANDEIERVSALLEKDVKHGFTIPLPASIVPFLPGAAVQPLGVVAQWTVESDGTRVVKHRLTQDLSFSSNKTGPERSVNSRVDMTAYPEMIYGWCLPRILHFVTSLRTRHPHTIILISKYDYSDAYRRIAHAWAAAMQTIAVVGITAYLSLRLTFGGCPNPPSFCLFSEIVTDLSNELGNCDAWDPASIFSPAQPTAPKPVRLPKSVPVEPARPMSLLGPRADSGRVDGFIDDLISVFLDTPSNLSRYTQAVPLAMHLTSRPHAGDDSEPIPRRPILSQSKLEAEGSPAEVQIVLGWRIDTRRMTVSLPDDKYKAWSSDLRELQKRSICPRTEIESLVGRLNHTSMVMPDARHFLGRIRASIGPTKGRRHNVRIGSEVQADLLLWEDFLRTANQGMPISLLVTRKPDRVCWSDACPFGMGGYTLSGKAWRIRIPKSSPIYGDKGVNNLLEFIGMAVNIWITCMEEGSDQACILAIGDNTSAIGWLHSTSRLDPTWAAHAAHLIVARKLARVLMTHRCCLASQHLKGESNLVADYLSFTGSDRGKKHPLAFDEPADDVLTARFHSQLSSQIPESFAISTLPNEVLSWITRVLQTAESCLIANKRRATKDMTEPGVVGSDSVMPWESPLTPSSLVYPVSSKNSLPDRFSASAVPQVGKPTVNLMELVKSQWLRTLSAKPQATWLRRSGAISGRAPCTSRAHPTCGPPSVPS